MSAELWLANIRDEAPKLIESEPSEKRALLLAALTIIEDRLSGTPVQAATPAQSATTAANDTSYDRATDELRAAEQYIAEGNAEFAADELKHAAMWIDRMQQSARTDEEKSQVRDLLAWHRLLQQQM